MKWQQILNQKQNTRFAFTAILIMMLLLTFVHRRNLSELQEALSSIYVDRLVAESHLYELSHEIYEKKIFLDHYDDLLLEQNIRANDAIQQLIKKYEHTYLTEDEGAQLSALKDHIRISREFEQQFMYGASPLQRDALRPVLTEHYDFILSSLNDLTSLQLQEGRKLIDQSSRIVASSKLTSRLGIALLVVLGLLIYFLFSSVPFSLRNRHFQHLN